MILKHLGTGAAEGWPGLFCGCKNCETARKLGGRNLRTRSQSAVYSGTGEGDDFLLIDFPPDVYLHCNQNSGLRLERISHLLVTHSHHDHFQPFELQYRMDWFTDPNRKIAPLTVYGNEAVHEKLLNMLKDEAFTLEQVGISFFVPQYFTPFKAGKFTVTAVKANHKPDERSMLYIIDDGKKTVLYGNDTGILPEEDWAYFKGKHFDLVSLDCTNGGMPAGGPTHMNLTETAETKKRLESIGCIDEASQVIITHFSHHGKLHYDAIVDAAAAYGMAVAYDGAEWEA